MSQAKHCVCLMYHALYADEAEWNALLDEEKPYAISTQTFELHLQMLQQLNIPVIHPKDMKNAPEDWKPGVVITFDDGHRSHFTHALPMMKKYNVSGFFFVTTDFMENDPRFCSWQELQDMHKAGLVIHGHGHTHQFFANMSPKDAKDEFQKSFELIAEHIEAPWSMSFPGGRYTERDEGLAKAQGFHHVFTSEIDVVQKSAFSGEKTIPRFAIRNTTQASEFKAMVMPSTAFLLRQKTVAKLKKTIKSLLGNHFYHWLYTLKAKG